MRDWDDQPSMVWVNKVPTHVHTQGMSFSHTALAEWYLLHIVKISIRILVDLGNLAIWVLHSPDNA